MESSDAKELRQLAQRHIASLSYVEALDAAEQSIAAEPESAAGHSLRAVALSRLGRGEEAASAFAEAARLEPGACRHQLNLAMQLRSLGKKDEALAAAREAQRIQPGLTSAQQLIAQLQGQPTSQPPASPPAPQPPPQPTWDPIKPSPVTEERTAMSQPQPWQQAAPQPQWGAPNTSGGGPRVELPYEATRWNWGAFLLTPLWALAHRLPLMGWLSVGTNVGQILLLAYMVERIGVDVAALAAKNVKPTESWMNQEVAGFMGAMTFGMLLGLADLGIMIWGGAAGSAMGWRARRFQGIAQFLEVQQIWMKWGVWMLIASVLLTGCCCCLGLALPHARG